MLPRSARPLVAAAGVILVTLLLTVAVPAKIDTLAELSFLYLAGLVTGALLVCLLRTPAFLARSTGRSTAVRLVCATLALPLSVALTAGWTVWMPPAGSLQGICTACLLWMWLADLVAFGRFLLSRDPQWREARRFAGAVLPTLFWLVMAAWVAATGKPHFLQ